jgi:hypothetical protein
MKYRCWLAPISHFGVHKTTQPKKNGFPALLGSANPLPLPFSPYFCAPFNYLNQQ